MIDGGYWEACHLGEASPSRSPGCVVEHNSGRQEPAELPWACWACSHLAACHAGFVACLIYHLEEEDAERRIPPESRPGRRRQPHFRCPELAPARSGTPMSCITSQCKFKASKGSPSKMSREREEEE